MRKFVSILIATLALCGQTLAQQVTGATITWYGKYIPAHTKHVPDGVSPTYRSGIGIGLTPPATNTDRIVVSPHCYFGFGYRLIGSPADAIITLRYVTKFPPPGIKDIKTGKMVFTSDGPVQVRINGSELFIGNEILNASTFPLGLWTNQVWYGDRLLAEKVFNVVSQDRGVEDPSASVPSEATAASPPPPIQTCTPLISMWLQGRLARSIHESVPPVSTATKWQASR